MQKTYTSFKLKLFRADSGYIRHETFSFMMSLLAMSLGLRFCVSRKGGTGGGGWVHPKGANSMAVSELVFRSDLVGTGRAITIFYGINGVKNKPSHLVGPPFPEFKALFSATAGWQFLRDLTRHLLIGGCGQSHVSGSSFEPNKPREQKLGYVLKKATICWS